MKKLLLILSILIMSVSAFAQNGGQLNDNGYVKLEFAGFAKTRVYNLQACQVTVDVTYNNTITSHTIPANGSVEVETAIPGTIKAKAKASCAGDDETGGQVELVITAQLLPVKFISFKARNIGKNSIEVVFQIAEARDVKHFDVQVSLDGREWHNVTLIFPDYPNPNIVYKANVDLSRYKKGS